MSNILLLMMGGIGSRFGADIPKQFIEVKGKPIYAYIINAYDKSEVVDKMVVVCNPDWFEYASNQINVLNLNKPIKLVKGGKTRSTSVKNGVMSLRSIAKEEDYVLIHDATHPYLDVEAVKKALDMMTDYDGVTICQNEYDTCYNIDGPNIISEIPKTKVVSGASPEIFRYGDVLNMCTKPPEESIEKMTSIGALALENGLRIGAVPTSILNIKITLPEDLVLFTELCSSYYFRSDFL